MSRIFTDENLETWEAFASGGKYGLPQDPMVVFNCLSDPDRRARFVIHPGDEADAQEAVRGLPDAELRDLLSGASELS